MKRLIVIAAYILGHLMPVEAMYSLGKVVTQGKLAIQKYGGVNSS
jgi:hypothetical protein